MKSLFSNPVYMLFILVSVIQFNAFVNMIFFMPKYLEQQYGKSTSDAVFLIGMFVLCISSPLPPQPLKNGEQCDDGSRELRNGNLLEYFCLWYISLFRFSVKSTKGRKRRKSGNLGFSFLFSLQ